MNVPFFRYDWFFQENREQIISVHEEIMTSGRYVYGEYTQKLEKQPNMSILKYKVLLKILMVYGES